MILSYTVNLPMLEWWPDKTFKEKVEEEKQKRLDNIAVLTWDDFLPQMRKRMWLFFQENWIAVDSLRKYLNVQGWKENQIDDVIPDINLKENEEEILNEINQLEPRKGNFDNPEELMEAIELYVKQNMSYDIFWSLNQLTNIENHLLWMTKESKNKQKDVSYVLKTLEDNGVAIDVKLLSEIKNVGSKSELIKFAKLQLLNKTLNFTKFEKYHLDKLNEVISKLDISELANDSLEVYEELKHFCNEEDTENVQKMFSTIFNNTDLVNLDNDSTFKLLNHLVSKLGSDEWFFKINNYENANEVNTYIKELKTWVCRHYSVIAKELFWKISPKLKQDSELLYVINYEKWHAYNLLLWEDENGDIRKKYYDLTDFPKNKKVEMSRKSEIRVQVNKEIKNRNGKLV